MATEGHLGKLVAQMVKNLPAMQENRVQSLGQDDPLEKGITTHSSLLAWRNPMDRGAWRATVHGVAKESDTTEHAHTHATDSSVGPGKGLVIWQKQL